MKSWQKFYENWFFKAFTKPLLYVDITAALVSVIGGAISYFFPISKDWLSICLWAIPLGALILSCIIGAILGPYLIYKELNIKHEKLVAERKNIVNVEVRKILSSFQEDISKDFGNDETRAIWKNKHRAIKREMMKETSTVYSNLEEELALLDKIIDDPNGDIEKLFEKYAKDIERYLE
jgi:hypothetical protein